MKKFVAILLTLMLVLGVSAAFAAGEPEFTKKLAIENVGTTAPDATFTFKYNFVGADDGDGHTLNVNGPALADSTVTLGGNKLEGTVTIHDDATYPVVGIYHYNVTEVNTNNIAGITNFNGKMQLKVTYYLDEKDNTYKKAYAFYANGEDSKVKTDAVVNTYSAGTLNVSKSVTGNLGDKTKYFKFTVTLTGEAEKTYGESYAVSGGSPDANNPQKVTIVAGEKKEYIFMLKDGDTISIANLPYGVDYTVTETPADGYKTSATGNTGKINADSQTAAFTNERTGQIDTGVTTENLPYVLLIGFVVLAGAALLIKRKAHNN